MIFAAVALFWALVVAGALAVARDRAVSLKRRAISAPWVGGSCPLLIRPCAGLEEGLVERLSGAPAGVRVRVAVGEGSDPAAAIARVALPDAEVVVTGARAANRKVGQIAGALRADDAEIVLWADSDVDLAGFDLGAFLAPLSDPAVAAVWSPVVERGPALTFGDRVSEAVLGGSMHAFPLLAHIDPAGMVGKLVAVRRSALDAVDFASMGDVLGEDMELARRLRAEGLRVAVSSVVGVARPRGRRLSDVVDRYARWALVVRAQRPLRLLGYPLVLVATPFVLALSGLAIARGEAPVLAALAAAVAIGTRLHAATLAARAAGRPASIFARVVDAVLADGVLLVAFVRALVSRRLSWRGRALRIGAGGRLVADGHTPPRAAPAAARVAALVVAAGLALAGPAYGLPRPGTQAPAARVHDVQGRVVTLERLRGKPVLIVYESRESSEQNQSLKDRLSRLAKGGRYRNRVHLLPIASVEQFNYFPIRGFVETSIAEESQRIGTAIFCDWDGGFRRAFALRPERSSVVLVSRDGRVIFAYEGALTRRAQDRLIELLGREAEDPAPSPPRQEALRDRAPPPGPPLVPGREAAGVPGPQSRLDRVELEGDGALLGRAPGLHVSRRGRGRADRDPEIGLLAWADVVAEADRHGQGALRDPGDRRGAGLEAEGPRRDRTLSSLREDPDEAAGRVQQARGVPDRTGAVAWIGEVDAERADVGEEREPAEVLRVHQGIRVDLEDARAQHDRDDRIPPRGVVRHDEHRAGGGGLPQEVEAAHAHRTEARAQAALRVAFEEAAQALRLVRRDHGGGASC